MSSDEEQEVEEEYQENLYLKFNTQLRVNIFENLKYFVVSNHIRHYYLENSHKANN